MTKRPLVVAIALILGAVLGDCGNGRVTPQDAGSGSAGRGGASGGSGGVTGGGAIAGKGSGSGGAAGCPYGFAGFNGTAGNGTGGTGTNVCATNFACGISGEACALGQEYCYGARGGAGSSGAVPDVCKSLPAACAGNPSCDCVCPNGLDNCPGLGFSCICNISDGALRLDCPGAGAAGGAGGTGGAGGCPFGLAGSNGAGAGGNGGGGGSSVLCATPPLCGSSTCAPDQEYCHSITFVGGAGQNGGGGTGNSGSGGTGGVGGAGGMTDRNHTCTTLPAGCAGNPSCACACPTCPTNGFPESCSCSVVAGEVIVSCIEYGI